MTIREKAVCEIFTGICFLTGDQRDAVYKYAEELLGRPVYTHEFATRAEELKEKARVDFVALCRDEYMDTRNGYEDGTKDAAEEALLNECNGYKFYYCDTEDSYLLGRRVGNFYYAHWHVGLGFVWDMSRYLPWGEHVVDENTAWKEHTYPSEPREIGSSEWFLGFLNQIRGRDTLDGSVKDIKRDDTLKSVQTEPPLTAPRGLTKRQMRHLRAKEKGDEYKCQ